jgi:hypothetical protein
VCIGRRWQLSQDHFGSFGGSVFGPQCPRGAALAVNLTGQPRTDGRRGGIKIRINKNLIKMQSFFNEIDVVITSSVRLWVVAGLVAARFTIW